MVAHNNLPMFGLLVAPTGLIVPQPVASVQVVQPSAVSASWVARSAASTAEPAALSQIFPSELIADGDVPVSKAKAKIEAAKAAADAKLAERGYAAPEAKETKIDFGSGGAQQLHTAAAPRTRFRPRPSLTEPASSPRQRGCLARAPLRSEPRHARFAVQTRARSCPRRRSTWPRRPRSARRGTRSRRAASAASRARRRSRSTRSWRRRPRGTPGRPRRSRRSWRRSKTRPSSSRSCPSREAGLGLPHGTAPALHGSGGTSLAVSMSGAARAPSAWYYVACQAPC